MSPNSHGGPAFRAVPFQLGGDTPPVAAVHDVDTGALLRVVAGRYHCVGRR